MPDIIDLRKKNPSPTPRPQAEKTSAKDSRPIPSALTGKDTRRRFKPAGKLNALPAKTGEPALTSKPASSVVARDNNAITWNVIITPKRSKNFLLVTALTSLALGTLLWFLEHNLLFEMVLVLTVALFTIQTRNDSSPVPVTINKAGVSINGHMRYWREFKSFWIEYNPGGMKLLSLELNHWYMPYLNIPLEKEDPIAIREFLILRITEREHTFSVFDAIVNKR